MKLLSFIVEVGDGCVRKEMARSVARQGVGLLVSGSDYIGWQAVGWQAGFIFNFKTFESIYANQLIHLR